MAVGALGLKGQVAQILHIVTKRTVGNKGCVRSAPTFAAGGTAEGASDAVPPAATSLLVRVGTSTDRTMRMLSSTQGTAVGALRGNAVVWVAPLGPGCTKAVGAVHRCSTVDADLRSAPFDDPPMSTGRRHPLDGGMKR